jgi:membrane-bound lytic murein transglycosylase D
VLGLLAGVAMGAAGQDAWPVDSLLATWPYHQRINEPRAKPRPGPVPDTDTLYAQLKRIAPALPVFVDGQVHRFVELFARDRRDHFRAMLGAAEGHLPMVEAELARHGMPPELKYLPFALSAYNPQATDRYGQAGLWMLTYPVAMRHGLEVTPTHDERRDPHRSTVAALAHLRALYARYGEWPTAVMAFAVGPANITRAVKRGAPDLGPRLLHAGFDSGQRAVLPRLMAFTFLAVNADAAGLAPLVFRSHEPADTVRFDSTLSVAAITHVVGTRPTRFAALNPTLTGGVVPAGTPFRLPRSEAARFADLAFVVLEAQSTRPRRPASEAERPDSLDRLPDGREAILYRIVEGDCIGCIADRFGVGLSELRAWNELRGDHIDVGNTLVIYVPPPERVRYESDTTAVRPDTIALPKVPPARRAPAQRPARSGEPQWYTVKKGDSLYLIAKRYRGVSADDIMRYNGIGADIRPGQKIKIPAP